MLKLIERVLNWLRSGSLKLLTIAGIILLIWGTLSPVGTLVWWLSYEAESLGFKQNQPKQLLSSSDSNPITISSQINCYVVFLPGVGNFSADQITTGEAAFINRLVERHPNCVAVKDVFPYSAANEGLGGERILAPLWRFANEADGWLNIAEVLIKVRNLWRFAISVDSRYGPVYNLGIANAIINRMNTAHPIPDSNRQPFKIILIGTSGGAQVALGAASYLDQWLDAQIIMVSIGGVFNGKDGFDAVERVYHLQGRKDWVEDIGSIVFPSRWSVRVASPFNQARRQGDYTAIISGSHAHDGCTGYFGLCLVKENTSVRYVDLTLQKVNQLPIWSVKKNKD